jgi:hypothetical protein
MIASLRQIAPRLKKLLLMLSSNRDGEVVNAARLIGTTLHSIGADWHDLVGGLLTPVRRRPQASYDSDTDEAGDWHARQEFCLQHPELLRPREFEFLTDLDRWRGPLTEKQAAWLNSIHARVRRHTG